MDRFIQNRLIKIEHLNDYVLSEFPKPQQLSYPPQIDLDLI